MNGLQKGLVSSAISTLLMACGGGGGGATETSSGGGSGGGGGGGSGGGSKALALNQHPAVKTRMISDSQREIEASCKFTQTIGQSQNDGMRIAAVNWLQVVGQGVDDPDTRLVAGKKAMLRIDLLANGNVQRPEQARIHVYDPDTRLCKTDSLSTDSTSDTLPAAIDFKVLDEAYRTVIPASQVKPGMRVYIEFNDSNGRSVVEADQTYRALAPEVVPALKLHVNVIPISYKTPAAGALVMTGSLGDEKELKTLIRRTLPFSQVTVETQRPVEVTLDDMRLVNNANGTSGYYGYASQADALTKAVDMACVAQMPKNLPAGTLTRCVAVLPDNLNLKVDENLTEETFADGLPNNVKDALRLDLDNIRLDRKSPHKLTIIDLGGMGWSNLIMESGQEWPGALFTRSISSVDRDSVATGDKIEVLGPYERTHWLTQPARTLVHELGHTAGLGHASCMVLEHDDARLYADGRLGANGMGYDEYAEYYFSVQGAITKGGLPQFADVMSYCGKEWMSDKGWRLMIDYLGKEREKLPYYAIVPKQAA